MKFIRTLAGIFFSPRRTFSQIDNSPRWMLPLTLAVVLSIGFNIFFRAYVDMDSVIRKQIEEAFAARGFHPSEEEMERQVELSKRVDSLSPALILITTPLLNLAAAGGGSSLCSCCWELIPVSDAYSLGGFGSTHQCCC